MNDLDNGMEVTMTPEGSTWDAYDQTSDLNCVPQHRTTEFEPRIEPVLHSLIVQAAAQWIWIVFYSTHVWL